MSRKGYWLLAFCWSRSSLHYPHMQDFTIAMVVRRWQPVLKHAARVEEATGELGLNFIFQAPATRLQKVRQLIDALIAQQVDAILVSANDPDALVPMLRRAMDRGIM